MHATRLAISRSAPDGVFALLSTDVEVHGSVFTPMEGTYGLDITGAFSVVVNDTVLACPANSPGLRVSGVASTVITGSLLSTDTSTAAVHVLECTDSAVDVTDSVLCTSGGATEVNPISCGAACVLSGPAGYTCNSAPVSRECGAACESADYCVPPTPFTTAPNFGCHECSGACWAGADNCSKNSTECVDDGLGGFYCDCLAGFQDNTGESACSCVV